MSVSTPFIRRPIATSLLLKRGGLDDHQGKVVARIISSSERARRLIRDFLDFTQARSSGRLPVTRGPANLRQIALQVFDEVHDVPPGAGGASM